MKTFICCLSLLASSISGLCQMGSFWGSTYGVYGDGGRIYRMDANGSQPTVLKTFSLDNIGGSTPNDHSLTTGGFFDLLYGSTRSGGLYGAGVIYQLDPYGFNGYHVVHNFAPVGDVDEPGPFGRIVEGLSLWGYRDQSNPILYRVNTSGEGYHELTPPSSLYHYVGDPIIADDANLYGISRPANGDALFVFRVASFDETFSGKFDFAADITDANIVLARDGRLYFSEKHGSTDPVGSLSSVKLDGTDYEVIVTFPANTLPARYFFGPDDRWYCFAEVSGNSVLLEIDQDAHTYDVLHEFEEDHTVSDVRLDRTNSYFIGVTRSEEVAEANQVFKINPDGTDFTVLAQLTAETGTWPGGITQKQDNTLFISNGLGGDFDYGTIVKVNPDGTGFAKVKDFYNENDGSIPGVHLNQTPSGDVLGVTGLGGTNNSGVLYKIGEGDEYKVVFNFDGGEGGANPFDAPVAGPGKFYYGMTYAGGVGEGGTIYKIHDDGSDFEKIFDFNGTNGSAPWGGLTVVDDRLYGMTGAGGANNQGVVFGIGSDGSNYQVLLNFNGTNGEDPRFSNLVYGAGNFLYGCASDILFKIKTNGTGYIKLFDASVTDYDALYADPFIDTNGDILVVATRGGTKDRGAIIRVQADGSSHSIIHEFDVTLPDANTLTNGHLTRGSDGLLYGLEPNGGDDGTGTVFKMNANGGNYATIELNLDDNSFGFMMPWRGLLYTPNKSRQIIDVFDGVQERLSMGSFTFRETARTSGLPVTYISMDESIATISGNVLTFLKAGNFTVIASQGGNDEYFAAPDEIVLFTILPPGTAQTVTFAGPETKTLGDDDFSLSGTASSGLPVRFSSDSDKIEIADGMVTLLKAGRATITASQSGDEIYDLAPPVERSFCINPSAPMITVNGSVLTSSNNNGNQWYLDGTPIDNATSKAFVPTSSGTYTVKTTIDNCSSVLSEEAPVIVVGIDDPFDANTIVFPNPASSEIYLRTDQVPVNVTLIDVLGRTIDRRTISSATDARFDIQSLEKGVYFLRISGNGSVIIRSFAKL